MVDDAFFDRAEQGFRGGGWLAAQPEDRLGRLGDEDLVRDHNGVGQLGHHVAHAALLSEKVADGRHVRCVGIGRGELGQVVLGVGFGAEKLHGAPLDEVFILLRNAAPKFGLFLVQYLVLLASGDDVPFQGDNHRVVEKHEGMMVWRDEVLVREEEGEPSLHKKVPTRVHPNSPIAPYDAPENGRLAIAPAAPPEPV